MFPITYEDHSPRVVKVGLEAEGLFSPGVSEFFTSFYSRYQKLVSFKRNQFPPSGRSIRHQFSALAFTFQRLPPPPRPPALSAGGTPAFAEADRATLRYIKIFRMSSYLISYPRMAAV
jgi:hypothetical protein